MKKTGFLLLLLLFAGVIFIVIVHLSERRQAPTAPDYPPGISPTPSDLHHTGPEATPKPAPIADGAKHKNEDPQALRTREIDKLLTHSEFNTDFETVAQGCGEDYRWAGKQRESMERVKQSLVDEYKKALGEIFSDKEIARLNELYETSSMQKLSRGLSYFKTVDGSDVFNKLVGQSDVEKDLATDKHAELEKMADDYTKPYTETERYSDAPSSEHRVDSIHHDQRIAFLSMVIIFRDASAAELQGISEMLSDPLMQKSLVEREKLLLRACRELGVLRDSFPSP
jgi:hypothetical protein